MSLSTVHQKIVALEKQMQAAAEAMDFETAARLRNAIAVLRGDAPRRSEEGDAGPAATVVSQPPPGAMGLGTHLPVVEPPKGWKKPKKPDPMTKNVRKR